VRSETMGDTKDHKSAEGALKELLSSCNVSTDFRGDEDY